MAKTYLFRAKLEFGWGEEFTGIPKRLPVKFGPFLLDQSPNVNFYFLEQGFEPEPGAKMGERPNWEYPVSFLYVESKIEAQSGQRPESTADDTLEQLEAMFRLFQEGDMYLRRHRAVSIRFPPPPKPEPAPLYGRGPYRLDDETLGEFIAFFNSYWDVFRQSAQLHNALHRFSASCEARTLADRLIELVVALEALFGDPADSLTYKIALRCASLLYPPGEARGMTFKTVKEIYGERSKILHGRKLDTKFTDEKICELEGDVRRAIIKFLEERKRGRPIESVEQLDELLFFRKEGFWPSEGKS